MDKSEKDLGKRYTNNIKRKSCIMIAENIQSSFWWIENEILFHFIVKTKTAI